MTEEKLFLGIDTSNYTTSCAVCNETGNVLFNGKRPLPVGENARGLRQSDAVFAHVKNLPDLMREVKAFLHGRVPAAVGVSATPRDTQDSYMPCFLSGIAAAEAFCAGCGAPLYRFSHQDGHISAAYHTSGARERIGDSAFISFHVSGGTTEILCVENIRKDIRVTLLGGTADLNAGQAIDRTGVFMGMRFPCGPEMERCALLYNGPEPKVRLSVTDTVCNLSGLENLAQKKIREGADTSEVSYFVFYYLAAVIRRLTENARERLGPLPVVYAGGVMSNSLIRTMLSDLDSVFFTEPCYSADNAAGIALLCRNRWQNELPE